MLAVQVPGESAGCSHEWREPWNEARDLMGISCEVRKSLPEKSLFVQNHRHVDHDKNQQDRGRDPPVLSSPAEADGQDQRTEIQRIAGIGVRAAGGEFFILLHVAGGEGADK